jgi:hypothetical protein
VTLAFGRRSAFCNAGFSTFSDGLAYARSALHVGVNLTIMFLITFGGLGFSVLWELWQWMRGATTVQRRRFSVQSRMVGLVTGLLILIGAGLFALLEIDGVLAERSGGERLLGALFQSITARTAGFNTLAIDALSVPATVFLLVLMLIGASPGSTGGGLKTTTVSVLFMTTMATIRGKARVEVFRRTLPWAEHSPTLSLHGDSRQTPSDPGQRSTRTGVPLAGAVTPTAAARGRYVGCAGLGQRHRATDNIVAADKDSHHAIICAQHVNKEQAI